jgi:hypothetical protein
MREGGNRRGDGMFGNFSNGRSNKPWTENMKIIQWRMDLGL